MVSNTNHFNEPHVVMLIFERPANMLMGPACEMQLQSHERYYRNLGVIYYGEIMNDRAVCAIARISRAVSFESIIENDPALQSGFYRIQQVVPFHDN